VRALLIVNPRATSTTRLRRDVIARALASAVKLEVAETRYRGHAGELAAAARSEGCDLIFTLGGDGTVNEAVNGILGPAQLADSGRRPAAADLPVLAALPGGSGNVFTGALGLPRDPVDGAGRVLQLLSERRERTIGLGRTEDRYFTFACGLGLDAAVVRAVQGLRAHGQPVSTALYVRLALRQFYRQTDRRHPMLTAALDGEPDSGSFYLGIVSNTAPWTYLGSRPVYASAEADFDTGLDLMALRKLSSVATFRTIAQMLRGPDREPHGRNILSYHDLPSLTLRSDRPIAFQIDGEYVGEREEVTFRAVPQALRVIG
jgi:diacylglycerol kinase family enzyme